jgi:RNA polymerase subunit RPABC4/transcription elongation factor Spt4
MITKQCPICDRVEIDGKWYDLHRAPAHEIKYTHKRCPKCSNKTKTINAKYIQKKIWPLKSNVI